MVLCIPSYRSDAVFLGRQALKLDSATSRLKTCTSIGGKDLLKTADYFIKKLQELRSGSQSFSLEEKHGLIQTADLFLKAAVLDRKTLKPINLKTKHPKELVHTLEKLDRYVTAEKFPKLVSPNPLSKEAIASLFTTDEAKASLASWVKARTHSGIKSKSTDLADRIVNSTFAAEAFLHHPEETDHFMAKLAQQIGRFNHHILVDPETFHHSILCEGRMTPISEIGQKNISDPNNSYRYDVGLTSFKRSTFIGELPPFRERKGAKDDDDYKLVIKTIGDGPDNHGWLELKSPKYVYNFGFYFTKESDKELDPLLSKCKSVFGEMRTPDSKEFRGKDDKVVKTVSSISQEQFLTLKKYIEDFQNKQEPKIYNMINHNCCSFVRDALSTIGLKLPSKGNFSYFLKGKDTKPIFAKVPILSSIERVFHRCIALIRNIVMLMGGGATSCAGLKGKGVSLFSSLKDFFNTEISEIDLPTKISAWQKLVENHRRKTIEDLKNSPGYQGMNEQEKREKERELRLKLPLDLKIEEPLVTI